MRQLGHINVNIESGLSIRWRESDRSGESHLSSVGSGSAESRSIWARWVGGTPPEPAEWPQVATEIMSDNVSI